MQRKESVDDARIKISVIIPCYNAEKYLERTFRALDAQTYRNFEVIIINDGSTDNSRAIAERLCAERKDCRVYSFENAGLSEARNRGIPYATGEYLHFLDADDWFAPNLYEHMVHLIDKYNKPDAVRWNYKWIWGEPDNTSFTIEDADGAELITRKDILDKLVSAEIGFSEDELYEYYKSGTWKWKEAGFVWRYLFKKSTVVSNNLIFPKGVKMIEDRIFNLLFFSVAQDVVCSNNVYHLYMQNEGIGLLNSICDNIEKSYYHKLQAQDQREAMRRLYLERHGIDLWTKYLGSNVLACFQLAVVLAGMPFFTGMKLYRKFVNRELTRRSLKDISTHGAPLKVRIPLLLLKNHLGAVFYTLVWMAGKFGVKFSA